MAQRYVYKCVDYRGGYTGYDGHKIPVTYWSCSPPHGCALEYEIGKWTRPTIENSGIFVFATLESAKAFSKGRYYIMKCTYSGRLRKKARICCVYMDKWDIRAFWKTICSKKAPSDFSTRDAPKGTYLVEAVRPVTKVEVPYV